MLLKYDNMKKWIYIQSLDQLYPPPIQIHIGLSTKLNHNILFWITISHNSLFDKTNHIVDSVNINMIHMTTIDDASGVNKTNRTFDVFNNFMRINCGYGL
jgi:hypothetical protein